MHPDWLSNAYLVADEEGGAAVYVDSGAPLEPLFEAAERFGLDYRFIGYAGQQVAVTIDAVRAPSRGA